MSKKDIKEYKEYNIEIIKNECNESPDDYENSDLFLVYDHRDFTVEREGFNPEDIYNQEIDLTNYYYFKVYAYIHSSIALSLTNDIYPFNDKWDVSIAGFIMVHHYNNTNDGTLITKEKAEELAQSLIKEWNQYLSGDVWGFEITKPVKCDHCEHISDNFIDSCYGIYGYDYCLNEAKEVIDTLIEKQNESTN